MLGVFFSCQVNIKQYVNFVYFFKNQNNNTSNFNISPFELLHINFQSISDSNKKNEVITK